MQQADATRIAALCDHEIVQLLDKPRLNVVMSREDMDIVCDLADLRNMYAGVPDLSEQTPQTAPLYGDGTPGNISQEIEREVMPAELAGSVTFVDPLPGETLRDAMARSRREHRGEEKFGFRIGETVNVVGYRVGDRPAKVVAFIDNHVWVTWLNDKQPITRGYKPKDLRHGP